MRTLHYSITSFMLKNWSHVFVLVSIIVVTHIMFDQTANASSPFLQIDKNTYVKGDIILVYGSVGSYTPNTLVTIQVLDKNNTQLLALTTNPKPDATFIVRIPTNDTDWKTGGPYDVKVQYGTAVIGNSTFVFNADQQLSPLQQTEAGIPFWGIKCDSGLVTIMKQEDGTVVCVKPSSLQKLIFLNWGYDPSEKLTVYGLKNIYKVGQEIDFKFRINGFGSYCGEQPSITVKSSDQKIVWQSPQYTISCPTSTAGQSGHMEDEAYLGSEAHLGYDYNGYGILIIKQTGTYSMNISWLDGNVTKAFTVIANQTSLNQNYNSPGNNTLHASFMPCGTPYPNGTGIAILYMPMNSIGKICVQYSNSNSPQPVGVRIFEAHHISQDTQDVTATADHDTIPTGNSTVAYDIKTTNQAGFYGFTIFCEGTPLAVGYDNSSTIVEGDFPWLGQPFYCPAQDYDYHIVGLTGIGVKYIP